MTGVAWLPENVDLRPPSARLDEALKRISKANENQSRVARNPFGLFLSHLMRPSEASASIIVFASKAPGSVQH